MTPTRALFCTLALTLGLAACETGTAPAGPVVGFADLPGEVRVEGNWDPVYRFAYVFVEYGGPQGTYGIRGEAGCMTLSSFEADVEGADFVVASGEPQSGEYEGGAFGCAAPGVVLEDVESLVSVTLRDERGDEILVEWTDLGVARDLAFENPNEPLVAGETARLVGPLEGDFWAAPARTTVRLSWFADDGPDSFTTTVVDATIDGEAVDFVVPEGLPSGVLIGAMVESPLFNGTLVCEGVDRCELEVGQKDGAEAIAD